jgi:hypothetical protein
MTTARQIEANRANARSSTGPRTDKGKARASRSALRHGLSIPVLADPALSKKVEDLAVKIAGENASPVLLELARAVAEAQIDLDRVRAARHELFVRLPGDVDLLLPSDLPGWPLMRYETRSSIGWNYSQADFVKLALKQLAYVRRTDPAERFVFELSDRMFTFGKFLAERTPLNPAKSVGEAGLSTQPRASAEALELCSDHCSPTSNCGEGL